MIVEEVAEFVDDLCFAGLPGSSQQQGHLWRGVPPRFQAAHHGSLQLRRHRFPYIFVGVFHILSSKNVEDTHKSIGESVSLWLVPCLSRDQTHDFKPLDMQVGRNVRPAVRPPVPRPSCHQRDLQREHGRGRVDADVAAVAPGDRADALQSDAVRRRVRLGRGRQSVVGA